MKRSLLIVSLFFAAPLAADSLQEAKNNVEAMQGDLDAARQRSEDLKAELDACQARIKSVAGKEEYADDMEREKENGRSITDKINQQAEQCKALVEKLEGAVRRAAKAGHTVKRENDKFYVVETVQAELEPVYVQNGAATNGGTSSRQYAPRGRMARRRVAATTATATA